LELKRGKKQNLKNQFDALSTNGITSMWRVDAFARVKVLDVLAQRTQEWKGCGEPTSGSK
jgi:hypothetical protein